MATNGATSEQLLRSQSQAFLSANPGSTVYLVRRNGAENVVALSTDTTVAAEEDLGVEANQAIARVEALAPDSALHLAATGIIKSQGADEIGLAYHAPEFPSGTDIYVLLNLHSLGQLLDSQNPAFSQVNLQLYAGKTRDPQTLVLSNVTSTGHHFGPQVQRVLPLGADNWLLTVQARTPLTAEAGRQLPWIILIAGLALAVVLCLLVESTQRRKDYALGLVAKRTQELSEAVQVREEQATRDALLRRTARDVAAAPNLARAFETVCETLGAIVAFDRANLSVVGDQSARVVAVGGAMANSLPLGTVWSKHDELVERALETGQSEIAHIDIQSATAGPNIRGRMAVPIIVAGALQALVTVASTKPGSFTELDLQNVERMIRETSGPLYLLLVLDRERDASQRLQQVDRLKSDFVGMVAHDLRSPMTVISGFADFLAQHLNTLSEDETRLYLRRISENTKYLAAFTEDVLQVARIESGELHIDLTEFDLGALVTKTADELNMTHPDRTIAVDVEPGLPAAVGDQGRQWQVINNLVANALKFSEASSSPVKVSVTSNTGLIQVVVADGGIGISPNELPHIFEKFYRVGAARGHAPMAGTGLGLYICKSLVEAQGGSIRATSKEGVGTTFTYTVPAAIATPAGTDGRNVGRDNAPAARGATSESGRSGQ